MDVMVDELKRGLEAAHQLHTQLTTNQPSRNHALKSTLDHQIQIILQTLHNCSSLLTNPHFQDLSETDSIPKEQPPCSKTRNNIRLMEPAVITTELKDDGYKWRKYGKKAIISSKYPREYYRCRFRESGCKASKYVQMIRDYPTIKYGVVYFGGHTCEYRLRIEARADHLRFSEPDLPNMLSFSHPREPRLEHKRCHSPNMIPSLSSPKRHKTTQNSQQRKQQNIYEQSHLSSSDHDAMMNMDRSIPWSPSTPDSYDVAIDCGYLMDDVYEFDNNDFSFGRYY